MSVKLNFDVLPFPVVIVPGHQSACFAGERQEKRGLK